MEEIILKSIELGALSIFCLLLLTKGINALNAISETQKSLTIAIEKLTNKLNTTNSKLISIEHDILELKQISKPK